MGTSRSIDPSRHGLRALVTRPRVEAESLAAALAARGIVAIIEPLLEIHYRGEPTPDLAGIQAILCTSANGVRALARLTPESSAPWDRLALLLGIRSASSSISRPWSTREATTYVIYAKSASARSGSKGCRRQS